MVRSSDADALNSVTLVIMNTVNFHNGFYKRILKTIEYNNFIFVVIALEV